MRLVRIIALTALLFTGIALLPQQSEASSSVGFFFGVNSYHPGYYHYYRPYYRPYFYRPFYGGFYNPYYFGYGFGYGYPGSYYHAYLAEIRTEVKPQDAQVYLDGDYVGVVDDFDGWWQRLEVPPGRHRLTFRAPGFAPYVVDVRVYPGRDAHIKYDLRRGQDQIADFEMRLPREERDFDQYEDRDRYRRRDSYRNRDDRYMQRDHDRYNDQERYNDQYRYDDRDRPYEDRDQQYDDRDRQYDEKPYFGEQEGRGQRDSNRQTFTLDIEPSDATVYVDGNYYGTANENGGPQLQILLPEGVHKIEVVRPGYNSFSQDVTVSRSGENRLAITLQKK